MPKYRYAAYDADGKKLSGFLDAADTAELQQKLKDNGLFLLESKEQKRSSGKPLKSPVLSDFSRQLGELVGAGVSMVRALNIISEEEDLKEKQRRIYKGLLRQVRQGKPLSEAMDEQGVFPPLMVNMFRSAEASGKLETTCRQMAHHYDKENKLKQKISSSLTYPKILGGLIVLVVVIIMAFVMPRFDELFATMPELPLATRILFGISDAIVEYWWLIILLAVAAIIGIRILFRIPIIRKGLDQVKVQLPRIGKLLRTIYTARFARTLSSLYACGISIVGALTVSKNVIGNTYITGQFDEAIAAIRGGQSLSDALSGIDGFNKKLASTVRIGEESGNLEEMLVNMADNFEYESEMSMNKLVAMVEPAMIIIMALIVAFVIVAVLMPIYDSYQYIG